MRLALFVMAVLAGCSGGSGNELDRLLEKTEVECGVIELDHTFETCPDTAAALRCFDRADASHIEQIFISDEGDPLIEHLFRVGGSITLIRDTRQDAWGPQGITRSTCTALVESEVTASGCTHIVCE